jgi:hypothetical protein
MVLTLNHEDSRGNVIALRAHLQAAPADIKTLYMDVIHRDYSEGDRYLLPTLLLILGAWRPLTPLELYYGVLHTGREFDPTVDHDRPSPAQVKSFIVNASKGLAEVIVPSRGSESGKAQVQFIHDSVDEYLLGSGMSMLDDSLRDNPSGSSHETLKSWCLEYVSLAGRKIRQSQQPTSTGLDDSRKYQKQLLNRFPFLSYTIRGLVIHAELAQKFGITQSSFVENFPLDLVIELSNLIHEDNTQHGPYPLSTSAADLFARLNAPGLLRLEVYREENESIQGERPELTDCMPELTMGSSARFDDGDHHDDTNSIRTDNEDNNIKSGERASYSKVFVSELRAGLDEFLHSKHCDHNSRSHMSAALPNLLKSYALLLARRARPGFEKDTVTFIRHTRKYVII